MRVQARWLVGLVLLTFVAVGALRVNERLETMTGRIDLDDHPSRTSIVFVLPLGEAFHYRLGQARVLRLIANANVAADRLSTIKADGRPLWIVLEIEATSGDGRLLHRQELALHLNPSGQQLDPVARSYLDHRLVPSAGKVRALDLSAFGDVDVLRVAVAEASPAIVDLSLRLFKVSRVAERELAYLWTRMGDERRETLARSNLYGQHMMTSSERENQLRHQWFPLPPEGSETRLQRRLYTRVDDGLESAVLNSDGIGDIEADTPLPAGHQRSFAYLIRPGEPFIHTVHHLDGRATPLRLDLRRLLPAGATGGGGGLRWRLLDRVGREISSGRVAPSTAAATSERVEPPGLEIGEVSRRYLLLSAEVAEVELAALGAPILVTLAVSHPLLPLRVSDDPEAAHKLWFLVRSPDHRVRFQDGRAVALVRAPTPPGVDHESVSWRRLGPDGPATWRSLAEPAEDGAAPGATRQRLALDFDTGSLSFTVGPGAGSERLLVLRWHAPAGRSEPLEIEVLIDGHLPVNRAMASWTYLRRIVTLPPGGGEYPVLGSAASAQAPQRAVVRIGPELGHETLRVELRSPDAAGYVSASLTEPASGEWRRLVDATASVDGGTGGEP